MADSFEAPSQKSTAAVPAVPSSTAEISVRTLASDIELMGKAGGLTGQGLPAAQVSRVATANDPVPSPFGALPRPIVERESAWVRPAIWTLIILVSAGVFVALGFYVAPLLMK